MLCFPNAKINIGLNIIEKRSDGYHSIETVFCPIGLSDIVEFVPDPSIPAGTCIFDASGISVDGPASANLCVKAYELLAHPFNLPGIHLHLHKIIPPGAGLGGGSADAAFMLLYLDRQFELKLGGDRLCDYASQLGSDCAFFIKNRPLFGYERGNVFRELQSFPSGLFLSLINPGIHISTAEAYAGITPHKPVIPLEELAKLPVTEWKGKIVNDFEPLMISKHPVIAEIRDSFYEQGAVYAAMSGSGSSVFGLFNKKAPAIDSRYAGCFSWSGPVS